MALVLMPDGLINSHWAVSLKSRDHIFIFEARTRCLAEQPVWINGYSWTTEFSRSLFTMPSAQPGELVRQVPRFHSPGVGEASYQLPRALRYF